MQPRTANGLKKNANDAEAICEAAGWPNKHFVATKTEKQQSVLMVHRPRTPAMANRTALVNQIRGLLAEFGIVMATGVARLRRRLPQILEDAENSLPALARRLLQVESIGPQTATAIVASIGDPHAFKSGRNCAALLGLTPRENSSGGKAVTIRSPNMVIGTCARSSRTEHARI